MKFLGDIFEYKNQSSVCGLTNELIVNYINNFYLNNDNDVLILTNSLYEANKIFQNLQTYNNDVCLFPMDDFLSSVALAMSPDLKIKRLETINKINNSKKNIIVTNLMGYLRYLPSKKTINSILELKKNSCIDRKDLISKLELYGYKRENIVSSTGEYAVRGYIIDIFPVEKSHPIRIELFGDEIESIRKFESDTQLSIEEIDKIKILPFDEIITEEKSNILEYLNNPYVFFINNSQILAAYNKLEEDIFEYNKSKEIDINTKYMYSLNEIKSDNYINIETVNNYDNSINYKSKNIIKFYGDYTKLKNYCLNNINNYKIIFYLSKDKQINLISNLFDNVNYESIVEGKINIIKKKINEGFIFDKYICISEYDIDDIKQVKTYSTSYKMGRKIKDFNELKVGDYVVHSTHGIGIYSGIVPITKGSMIRDYIMIQYLGNDKVYIPVEKISTIYKYSSSEGTPPRINKLNSTSWAKTKLKVKNKIHDISEELIKLYASRSNIKGVPYKDFEDEIEFGSLFEYNETSDQLKCIKEIDADLKKNVPMDRLLCGDVGFGKTEVAFRGMFKTVINGFQVAYLCPTTLLSRQQYQNALERFKNYPINIALLNRFTSQKKLKEIYNGLKNGSIDIVFGTHKLLNKDIEYKALGMLIIDEEQRFGVTHKEKIKQLKKDVNVLTLSATPIPRTMKMAMSGLRDLSIIDTAPINRYPIQTYVIEENDFIIKDAIYKELSRNGQIFIVHNRVETIESVKNKIQELVPEAKITIAHGKMDKTQLENVVTDFIDNKYDILISTTIIETGIDIPNVNTLIILDADMFGLSQLYQLRGRVGRSDKIAYAYLMYNKAKVLTETALKRLESIKEFTELGSGYKIAMRDLSIRGAGDLLGSEQAGFIETIGLELYTQMVNEEIKRLNGEETVEEENQNPLIEVANHISDDYVSEESIKIEIHKLINTIQDEESLENVKKEIKDRFGYITDELDTYMHEEWFEKLASKLKISRVIQTETIVDIELPEDISDKIDGEKLFFIVYNINPKFKLSYKMKKIHISLSKVNLEKHFIYYEVKLLNEIENMVKNK